MASKKPKMNLGPIDDTLRKLLTEAVKKARKSTPAKKATKAQPKNRKAGDSRYVPKASSYQSTPEQLKAAKKRFLDRQKRMGPSLSAEQRSSGKKAMLEKYDNMLKSEQVNTRIAGKDAGLFAIRESKGKPVTGNQINKARKIQKGMKKNVPSFVDKMKKKSEGQNIADAAAKAERQAKRKAAGGVNSPDNMAKRQAKRAEQRKKKKK